MPSRDYTAEVEHHRRTEMEQQIMTIHDQAMTALDILESSETLHEFEDFVTLRVDRDLWEAFLRG